MFITWKWNKNKNKSEPVFKGSRVSHIDFVYELIKVIAKNRQRIWQDEGINLSYDMCIKKTNEKFNKWILSQHSKDVFEYQIIDKLEDIFYNIEIEHSNIQRLCALEYGM